MDYTETSDVDEPTPGQQMTLEQIAKAICDKIKEPRKCEHCGKDATNRIVARAICLQESKEVIIAVSMHDVTNLFRDKGIEYRMYVQSNSQLFFRFNAPGAL